MPLNYLSEAVFLILTLALMLVWLSLFLLHMRDFLTGDVPFVSTRKRVVSQIIDALQLSEGNILYDLGCGNGSILKYAVTHTKGVRGVGIENGIIPFLIARINTKKLPIEIIRENFFETNISSATHVYVYLSIDALKKLAPKILRECKKGTRVVSCDYEISDWVPIKIIDIANDGNRLGRKLYVYETTNKEPECSL